jgi:hypothetical protein
MVLALLLLFAPVQVNPMMQPLFMPTSPLPGPPGAGESLQSLPACQHAD